MEAARQSVPEAEALPPWLTPAMLAERQHVSVRTLANRRSNGTDPIPHTKIGTRVLYARADVLAHEARCVVRVGRAAGRGAA